MSYPAGGSAPSEPSFSPGYSSPPLAVTTRPPKFSSRKWLHALLLLTTILTTTWAGYYHYAEFASDFGRRTVVYDWNLVLRGFWYSGTLLAILGAHEMGHYLYCRRYNVDATPPYFIPVPALIFWTGTLGAVIKIREPFPTRRILFDIGVAGPIAGFAVLVPALVFGMSMSELVAEPPPGTGVFLGEPLLFQWVAHWTFGAVPAGLTINMHPVVFATWFGMLATYWNLLPFGQFDGGHLTYATLGRASKWVSLTTAFAAMVMTFVSVSWLVMTLMMLFMLKVFGPSHPPVLNPYEPLPRNRHFVALLALAIFIVCFMPIPIRIP